MNTINHKIRTAQSDLKNEIPSPFSVRGFRESASSELTQDSDKKVQEQTNQHVDQAPSSEEIDLYTDAYFSKQWGTLERLGNRSLYKTVQNLKGELITCSIDARIATYRTLIDTRLKIQRERCEACLLMVGSQHRLKFSQYVLTHYEVLSKDVQQRQFSLFQIITEKYAYLEKLTPYPSMYKKYLASIKEEETRTINFFDNIMLKFEALIKEGIKKYQISK